jgi:hypothetical protein
MVDNMKVTFKDGTTWEVKTGAEWSVDLRVKVLDPDGFYPRSIQAPAFDSLMDRATFERCMCGSTCEFLPGFLD